MLALLILLKYVLLNSIPVNMMTAALLIMPVISRWAMVYAIVAYPYARQEGLGKAFKLGASRWRLITASLLALLLAIMSGWFGGIAYYYFAGLVIMLVIWVIIIPAASYFKRKFAGLTGDTYGAINEIAEVGVLILTSIFAFNEWFM